MRIHTRSSLALLALVIGGLGVASCGDSDSADGDAPGGSTAETVTVKVEDNFFDAKEVEVAVGSTVAWEWVGAEPHNVVGDDFKSEIQTEGTFEKTFEESGTYDYVCTVHPGMEGTVEVSD